MLDLVPGALVLGFFLAPDVFVHPREAAHHPAEVFLGEGVQLFDADDRHVLQLAAAACLQQVVVDLSGTHHQLRDLRFVERIEFIFHRVEAALAEGLDG